MIELAEIGFLSLATFHYQRSLLFFFMVTVFLKTLNIKCLHYLNINLIYQEETWIDKVFWNFISSFLMYKMSKCIIRVTQNAVFE